VVTGAIIAHGGSKNDPGRVRAPPCQSRPGIRIARDFLTGQLQTENAFLNKTMVRDAASPVDAALVLCELACVLKFLHFSS